MTPEDIAAWTTTRRPRTIRREELDRLEVYWECLNAACGAFFQSHRARDEHAASCTAVETGWWVHDS